MMYCLLTQISTTSSVVGKSDKGFFNPKIHFQPIFILKHQINTLKDINLSSINLFNLNNFELKKYNDNK